MYIYSIVTMLAKSKPFSLNRYEWCVLVFTVLFTVQPNGMFKLEIKHDERMQYDRDNNNIIDQK